MMGISYEPGDFEDSHFEVTPDDIHKCASVETLMGWKGDLLAQVEARTACGTDDDEWAGRVFACMGLKRTKRRLRAFGVNPDPLCTDDQKALDKAREGARFAAQLLVAMGEALPRTTVEAIKLAAMDRAIDKAFAA